MKKTLSVLILFCLFISCERKEPDFSEEMIEKLSLMHEDKELGLLPSKYIGLDLYIWNNKEIYMTNNHDLFFCYKKNYFEKFNSFESFLNAVLNQNFILDKDLIKGSKDLNSFKLNEKIEQEYLHLGFDKFLKKYSDDNVGKERLKLNRSIIRKEEFSTVKYFLYKNKYDVEFDDPHAAYYAWKRVDSFK